MVSKSGLEPIDRLLDVEVVDPGAPGFGLGITAFGSPTLSLTLVVVSLVMRDFPEGRQSTRSIWSRAMAVCSFLLITTRLSSVNSSILTSSGWAVPFLYTRNSVPVLSSLSLAQGSSAPKASRAVQKKRTSFHMNLSYCFPLH